MIKQSTVHNTIIKNAEINYMQWCIALLNLSEKGIKIVK